MEEKLLGENARDSKGRFLKGRKFTEAQRKALSERRKQEYVSGERKPLPSVWKGKRLPKATCRKISAARMGMKFSVETRSKLSAATKAAWLNEDFRRAVVTARAGSTQSVETIEKRAAQMRGENHPNWKGGITPLVMRIRNCWKMQTWRRQRRAMDGGKCIECDETEGLAVDHIKPFSQIMALHKLKSYEEAMRCEELWDINNGRTLCRVHHTLLQAPYHREYAR